MTYCHPEFGCDCVGSDATVVVATMTSEHYEWVAVGLSADEARRGIAAAFEEHLRGQENLEWFYANTIGLDAAEERGLPTAFGEHESLASTLDEWYGIATREIGVGKGAML